MRIFLVGGGVRDMLLGLPVKDRDYLVYGADREEFMAAHPQAQEVGKSFPVFLLNGMEFALSRGKDVFEDLLLRDLTINALAIEVDQPENGLDMVCIPAQPDDEDGFIAHPQALDDLRHKILRPASPRSFSDDPLRVFRAARFAAILPDFTPHPDLIADIRSCAASGVLADLPADRVGEEIRKALAAPAPSRFLEILTEGRALAPWLSELDFARHIPAGPAPYHTADVLRHTREVMDRLAGNGLRVWMGLCHDLGKIATDPASWPHHHGHESKGESLARDLGLRLRLPQKFIRAGMAAAAFHMMAGRYGQLRPGTRVDLLTRLNSLGLVREMFELARADRAEDYLELAMLELERLLAVRLPEADRDRGRLSGEKLRMLRAQVLAERR